MICFGLYTDPNMCQKNKHDTNTCLLLWHKPGESHGFILLMRYPDLAIRVSALGFVRTGSLQHVFEKFQHLFADYVLTQCTVSEKACHYLKELKRSMVFHCCSSGSKLDKVVCWGDLLLIAVLRLLLGHMRSSCHTEQVLQFSLFWKRSWIAFFSTPPW